jgi:hypothetical protein
MISIPFFEARFYMRKVSALAIDRKIKNMGSLRPYNGLLAQVGRKAPLLVVLN